jgi:transcriptional antiterminator RfaH
MWNVAQVKPGQYERARTNLVRQGYEVAMPRLRKATRKGGRTATRLVPLFPGYAFIREPAGGLDWRPINATYGIGRLIAGENGRPARLPPGFVESLLSKMDPDGVFSAPPPAVAEGDDVEIVAGPFAGIVARLVTLTDTGRIRVLLDLLGRSVHAEVHQFDLDIVARAQPGH